MNILDYFFITVNIIFCVSSGIGCLAMMSYSIAGIAENLANNDHSTTRWDLLRFGIGAFGLVILIVLVSPYWSV